MSFTNYSAERSEEALCHATAELGLLELREQQRNSHCVCRRLQGNDVFVCLPTRRGKSLRCLLPKAFDTPRSSVSAATKSIGVVGNRAYSLR